MTLGLAALLLMNVVPNTEAAGGWSSSVSPSFAFNGDNVTLTVTGIPGNFAFIKILLGNETLDTQLVYLDDMGKGSVIWNVPILASTGTYRFIVVSNGVNVTEASVSIIFDENTFNAWVNERQAEEIERLNEMLDAVLKKLNDVDKRIFWMWAAASVTCGFAVMFAIITVLYYIDELKAKAERWKRLDGVKGKASRFYKTYFDPELDGWMVHTIPTLATEAARVKKKNAPPTVEPFVTIPDASDPRGYRTSPVKVAEEPMDVPVVETEPVKANQKKGGDRMKRLMKKLQGIRLRLPRRKDAPIVLEDVSKMESRLAEMEEVERRSKAPERVEQPPTPSSEVGTPPEKPQDAVHDAKDEEVPSKAENATKPRKKASSKPRSTKPRAKKAVVPKEAVKEALE